MDKNLFGYPCQAVWSEEDQAFVARVLGAQFESIAAHGVTPDEALAQLKIVFEDALFDFSNTNNEA